MTDTIENTHSEMMKLKAKKKTLHRRTQSNTAFDMNNLLGKETHDPELLNQIVKTYDIMDAEKTEKAIEASKNTDSNKEIIVDDIDEIPNTGYVVPKYHSSNNPMNFIRKRNLSTGSSLGTHQPMPRTLDLLNNAEIVSDLIGLNTIFEKRNSLEDIDLAELKSSDSRTTSKTHSRNPSQADPPKPSSTVQANPSSAFQKKANKHMKHLSADFRPLSQDSNLPQQSFTPKGGVPDLSLNKKNKSAQNAQTNTDLMNKRSKLSPQPQISMEKNKENVARTQKTHHRTISSNLGDIGLANTINKQKAENFLHILDRPKNKQTLNNRSKGSPSGKQNIFKQLEIKENLPKNTHYELNQISPSAHHEHHYSFTPSNNFLSNAKTFQDVINLKNLQSARMNNQTNKPSSPKPVHLETKVTSLNETVKNLTDKTKVLEEQIKSLNQIINILRQQKGDLEKVTTRSFS